MTRSKDGFVKTVAVLVSALALAAPAEADVPRRPNIVYIFSDDHALQAISAYGSRYAKQTATPNIAYDAAKPDGRGVKRAQK